MGELIRFVVPSVRVRRRKIDAFCEVTVLPDRPLETGGAAGDHRQIAAPMAPDIRPTKKPRRA